MKLLGPGIGNTLRTDEGVGCMSCRHSILIGGTLPDVTTLAGLWPDRRAMLANQPVVVESNSCFH